MVVGELEIYREINETDLYLTSYPKLETIQISDSSRMDKCTGVYSFNDITHHHENEQTIAIPHIC